MATVTHIIRSHYDPADREKLERETGQQDDDPSDPWQTESSFSAQRRIRAAPTFVPATISYDEWGTPSSFSSTASPSDVPSTSTAEWYRSLTAPSESSRTAPPASRPSSAPNPSPKDPGPFQSQNPSRFRTEVTQNDWFIRNALRTSELSTNPGLPAPAPSLADLLARDPPPLPSEERYVPPVWLHIGPSNRGFGMLQRSGWNEGEGLGAHVARRTARANLDGFLSSSIRTGRDAAGIETTPEVIDLTHSDSEVSDDTPEDGDGDTIEQSLEPLQIHPTGEASASHMQKSLLTPLPVVLKADRLGIGLKAKTEGPSKRSKKRVTHNAAALAAHLRTAEEVRRKKAVDGKGKRGFARIHEREEDRRKTMLAYLNE